MATDINIIKILNIFHNFIKVVPKITKMRPTNKYGWIGYQDTVILKATKFTLSYICP